MIIVSIETAFLFPEPVNCAGVLVVGLGLDVFVPLVPPTSGPLREKFAQVIRVLLAK